MAGKGPTRQFTPAGGSLIVFGNVATGGLLLLQWMTSCHEPIQGSSWTLPYNFFLKKNEARRAVCWGSLSRESQRGEVISGHD